MSYASPQDLTDRFDAAELIALTDRAGAGEIDATVVARALADADATIDSYVGRHYRLPLAPVPARVVRVACDLARRYLYTARPTDDVLAAEKAALAWLRDVSTGAATLDVAGIEPAAVDTQVLAEPGRRQFTRDSLRAW